MKLGVLGAAIAASIALAVPAVAQHTIIDDWANIKAPPAPALKEVTADPATTALIVADFGKQTCNAQVRPRCVATVPPTKALLAEARAKQVLVVYTIVMGVAIGDTVPELAPLGNEPYVQAGPDKFLNTDLEKILKDHGIKTAIMTGTAAHGVIMHTGDEAVFRGFSVIVPIDTISADSEYVEQYVAYNFTAAPRLGAASTLTRVSMIKFK